MDTVSVAELKSRLSHYLREVRAGKSFTVLSRDIPVATLGPWVPKDADELELIPPDPDAVSLYEPLLEPSRRAVPDAVELLRRDRDDRDARLATVVAEALAARDAGDENDAEGRGPAASAGHARRVSRTPKGPKA